MLKNKQLPLIYLFLTLAALAAFRHVTSSDFINLDDHYYVTENIHIANGITAEAIRWAFTTGHAANWHPLTWLSHALDVQLFGLNPHRHHLINLLFHIASTLLLFFVFDRMTKAPWKSAFVAALFAFHPLHVESVAWVAERKDVLSTFFWMLTMAAYVYYVERPRAVTYLPVFGFLALGLMAKPMLVTLPFVLLLLDYWPLQRFGGKKPPPGELRSNPVLREGIKPSPTRGTTCDRRGGVMFPSDFLPLSLWERVGVRVYPRPLLSSNWYLIWEKMPLFALSATSCIVTFVVQRKGGAVISLGEIPLGGRIANAFVSYVIYVEKTVWPQHLAVFYPYQKWTSWQVLGAVLFFTAVTSTVIWTAKRFRYLTVGWLWFVGTLVPVIGVVQVGDQAMADRYSYIPLVGLFIAAAWTTPELLKKWRYRSQILFASSALIVSYFFAVTWTQTGYWRNSFALYDHALEVTGDNCITRYSRGAAFLGVGDTKRAIEDYDRAIELCPEYAKAYTDRGNAYSALGNQKQAISDYSMSIEADPEYAIAYYDRGNSHVAAGNLNEAISDYDKAVEIDPDYQLAYINRGIAYCELGNPNRALKDFDKAIEINPKSGLAYINRGITYRSLGQQDQAIEDLRRAAKFGSEEARDLLRSQGMRPGN